MDTTQRVTVTLPKDLVRSIGRVEANRSRFIAQAVEHELARRRHEEFRRSLDAPHAGGRDLVEEGLEGWGANLPEGDEDLVDLSSGTPVQWIEGRGWIEDPR